MKKLFTQEQYEAARGGDLLPLQCCNENCNNTFFREKKAIKYALKKRKGYCQYCSIACGCSATSKRLPCDNCGKIRNVTLREIKKYKHHFCSQSCAATYNNTHKTYGYRRSKLEIWLEKQLNGMYPQGFVLYNYKEAINFELDIYFQVKKIAFEINGIYHYSPIRGQEKLDRVQYNDEKKKQLCKENGIVLYCIDVSKINFNVKHAEEVLNFIIDKVDPAGHDPATA